MLKSRYNANRSRCLSSLNARQRRVRQDRQPWRYEIRLRHCTRAHKEYIRVYMCIDKPRSRNLIKPQYAAEFMFILARAERTIKDSEMNLLLFFCEIKFALRNIMKLYREQGWKLRKLIYFLFFFFFSFGVSSSSAYYTWRFTRARVLLY